MKNILLIISCLLLAVAHSQTENSLDLCKEGFYAQYCNGESHVSIDSLDKVYYAYKGEMTDTLRSNSISFMRASADLHSVGKVALPVSRYVMMTDEVEPGKLQETLYVMQDSLNKSACEKLKKKYGCRPLGNDTVLIPAKWFTGQIVHLYAPFVYGNSIVARYIRKATYCNGIEDERKKGEPLFQGKESWLDWTVYSVRSNVIFGEITLDERGPDYRRKSAKEMELLGCFVNRLTDRRLIPFEAKAELSVMLTFDSSRKAHVEALLPKEMSLADCLWLTLLSDAIEQLPARTFDMYLTEYGDRFPCLYLKAKFSRQRWYFTDYSTVSMENNH